MGEEAEEGGVVGHGAVDFDTIVGDAGWDDEAVVGELEGEDALGWRRFGEDEADAGLVGSRVSRSCGVSMSGCVILRCGAAVGVGDVVHLEDEVAVGGD